MFTGFKDLVPLYGKGYLGQGTVTVTDDSSNVGFTKLIQGGTIVLDSMSASIDIKKPPVFRPHLPASQPKQVVPRGFSGNPKHRADYAA